MHSMDQIGVWLLVIVLVAPIAIGLYTDDTSCGQGTVLEGHQCTPIGWQGEWTEIEMNFDYDKFSVNEVNTYALFSVYLTSRITIYLQHLI